MAAGAGIAAGGERTGFRRVVNLQAQLGGTAVQGKKTHEQLLRTIQGKDDVPKPGDPATTEAATDHPHPVHHPEARQSEFPVSRGGLNQESQHNKHNDGE